jgi:transcriptional regulator with XRE-family HTH domain
MSLADVARATQLTRSFLSLVERDETAPSVASLIRICGALDISVGSLFDRPRTALVRADQRPQINFGGQGVSEYLLTPASSRLQILHSTIEPLGGGGDEPYALAGEAEFVLVLSGRLAIEVDGVGYELAVNDSLSFSPGSPHTWRNPSETERAVVLWVLTPSPW